MELFPIMLILLKRRHPTMNILELTFSAAVERPLSVVFRTPAGHWEGHDYIVEVVAQRKGLNRCDVVVDFRKLEKALDHLLKPLQGCLLSDLDLKDPLELAQRIARDVTPLVPPPAHLAEVSLRDGQGRRLAIRPQI